MFWSTAEWARAIAELGVEGPLPERTVVVPRSRVAHQLRKELIVAGRAEALVGARFVTPVAAALEVLAAAGKRVRPDEDGLRPARIAAVLRTPLALEYFRADVVGQTPGWDDAFARTIGELESAGLTPNELPVSDPRWRDIAALWRALDESAGDSWTSARILSVAADALEADAGVWPFRGPSLVTVADTPSVAWARFARSVPNASLGVLAGRPVRVRWLERLEELFGRGVRDCVAAARPPALGAKPSERAVMSSFLFEPAHVLADPARPRSAGIDGSVVLEEHAGVESELEATVDWVARKVLAGIPLEEIAVLAARPHPVAALLADRLRGWPSEDEGIAVHLASGYPLSSTAAGARVIAVVRAVRSHLALEPLAAVLPFLRLMTDGEGVTHLSRSDAIEVATGLGTIGGHPAKPSAALEWSERLPLRMAALEDELGRPLDSTDPNVARDRRAGEQLLSNLRAVRPAIDALTEVTRLVLDGASLTVLAGALCQLIDEWVLAPAEGAPVGAVLGAALSTVAGDPVCGSLSGDEALDWIEETLSSLTLASERYGRPAVYVGSPRGAVGLGFQAVRVIGLAEGSIPSAPREDPVIPATAKAAVCPWAMNEADVVLSQLHALDRVVRDGTGEVVLSFARTDLDGTQHEPSSVFIEAGAALARPGAGGSCAQTIPDLAALARLGFVPARERARRERARTPLGQSAWLDRVASAEHHAEVPSGWLGAASLELERIRALQAGDAVGPLDGILGEAGAFVSVPGLHAERPMSASALDKLLGCPFRFLLERLLYWEKPAEAGVSRSLDARTYGGLLHSTAERFYAEHGAAFGQRDRTLGYWQEQASAVARAVFDEEIQWFPLPGDDVRATQLARLTSNVHRLLELDWNEGAPRQFVAVERSFGYDEPLTLECGLYVHGQIDRLDVEGRVTLVRDLKTGKGHPRAGDEEPASLGRDVQIGVYALVVERLAKKWRVPRSVAAAYVYVDPATDPERAFRDDYASLRSSAEIWIDVAHGLLKERAFPKAANAGACTYCAHGVLCDPASTARGAHAMQWSGGAAAGLLKLHVESEEES